MRANGLNGLPFALRFGGDDDGEDAWLGFGGDEGARLRLTTASSGSGTALVVDLSQNVAAGDLFGPDVTRTAGFAGMQTGVIPLPAAGWLLLLGLGALALAGRPRRRG